MDNELILSLLDAIKELVGELQATRANNVIASTEIAAITGKFPDARHGVLSSDGSSLSIVPQPGSDSPHDALSSLEDVRAETAKAQLELEQLVREIRDEEKRLADLRKQATDSDRCDDEMAMRCNSLTSGPDTIAAQDVQQAASREIDASDDARYQSAVECDAKLAEWQAASSENVAGIAKDSAESVSVRELLRKIWPDWLCKNEMQVWRELIEEGAYSNGATSSFLLLFAAIHNYKASQGDPDHRIFLDALRDLGRRLYQWLRDMEYSECEMADVAELWSSAINEECRERGSVQVAVPGNPASSRWMNFTPKAGGSPDITLVRSWCVSDSQGRPIHRAEIAV